MSESARSEPFEFAEIARVPANGDNVAIATRTLPTGTRIWLRQIVFELAHTVLEGHRFAIFRIRKGEELLSWGLPFGVATRDVEPGEYVCNEKILRALSERHVAFELPKTPNFLDYRLPFKLDEGHFKAAEQVRHGGAVPTFAGFRRTAGRGAGTRNYIVVMGTSARTGTFARAVAARFREVRKDFPNVDGVVPVEHTEGGSDTTPLNRDLTLSTLAGFMVNPNVGAVLCLDYGDEPVNNAGLEEFLKERNYPTAELVHRFLSVQGPFEQAAEQAVAQVRVWLPRVNQYRREPLPASLLNLGLQCGGSDAFSGVSANPLVGLLSRDVVGWGGMANLAETSELIGAEKYVLEKVRDLETARAFLRATERFQEWAGWHGHSAEGNPSGGNMYRGLYNISIKSIGAARKKDPATRLDYVIGYGERMTQPGFYFMDSPGNDLESIAGQVAAGCNLILFATGNGSITNFPFVPTIKIMTTSARFELVRNEMDFNAGRYQDGEPLDDLGREAFGYMLKVASGEPSAGENAGHAQVQLWREWRQNGSERREVQRERAEPFSPTKVSATPLARFAESIRAALVLPTSLCSGEIARMVANRIQSENGQRAVTLPHTEGCGNSGGDSERLFLRTMAGYLAHPLVSRALLLEHGCEKTHNDAFRNILRELKLPETAFGWASVQMDGGIDRVVAKASHWFASARAVESKNLAGIGFHAPAAPANVVAAFRALAEAALAAGGFAVLPQGLSLWEEQSATPTISYGEHATRAGVHRMETPTTDVVEILTGLAASGAQLLVVWENRHLIPENPLVPTIQIAQRGLAPSYLKADVDLLIAPNEDFSAELRRVAEDVLSGKKKPRSRALRNSAFQITRGYTGISL